MARNIHSNPTLFEERVSETAGLILKKYRLSSVSTPTGNSIQPLSNLQKGPQEFVANLKETI